MAGTYGDAFRESKYFLMDVRQFPIAFQMVPLLIFIVSSYLRLRAQIHTEFF